MTLVQYINEQLEDVRNDVRTGERIVEMYNGSTEDEKIRIDQVFLVLCNSKLGNMIKTVNSYEKSLRIKAKGEIK